jgi:hypothetical protein
MSDATARLIELDCVLSADQAKEVIELGDQRVNGVDSLPCLEAAGPARSPSQLPTALGEDHYRKPLASELVDREGGEQGWDGGQRDTSGSR